MTFLFKKVFSSHFFDKNIKSNIILRIVQLISQFLIIVLVGNVLTKENQGYYFALNSYAALSVLFELGFGFVIMQFIAHESADIKFEEITIETKNIAKISSLFKFSIKWFSTISLLYLLVIYFSAPYFFNSGTHSTIEWKNPLLLLSSAIGINIFLNGIYSFLDGCRLIYFTSRVRTIQVILFIILFTILILNKFNLYAYGIALLLSLLISIIIIMRSKLFSSIQLLLFYKDSLYESNWFKTLLPLQWRIALSWAVGYLIFQIPALFSFKYCGAVTSGKLNLSITILIGISTLSAIFINTRLPIMATLTAQKQFEKLNSLFKDILIISFLLHFLLIVSFIIFKVVIIDYYKLIFVDRLLPTKQLAILFLTSFIGVYTGTVAAYVRSNREEPLMFNAIASAIITIVLCNYFLSKGQIENYLIYNLLLYLFVEIPWFYIIFKKYKYKKYVVNNLI